MTCPVTGQDMNLTEISISIPVALALLKVLIEYHALE